MFSCKFCEIFKNIFYRTLPGDCFRGLSSNSIKDCLELNVELNHEMKFSLSVTKLNLIQKYYEVENWISTALDELSQ